MDLAFNVFAVHLDFVRSEAEEARSLLHPRKSNHLACPWKLMAKLCKANLKLRLSGRGPLRKDFEDELEAVYDFDTGDFGEIVGLTWRKRVVEDNLVSLDPLSHLCEFAGLPPSDLESCVGSSCLLNTAFDAVACGFSQAR
jgi:hypothetical protein